jgi:hypothetical protein
MSETAMWSTMRMQMGKNKYWREATRHEDKLQEGIADVSYISSKGFHGWIELKKIKEWPKRKSTIVKIDHYTDDQRRFLKRKGEAGGLTWLFLQVNRDYLLFNWSAAQDVGRVEKDVLIRSAFRYFPNGCRWRELGIALNYGP